MSVRSLALSLGLLLLASTPLVAAPVRPDPAGGREAFVVGVYEGFKTPTGGESQFAYVTVNRPKQRVTLVLMAYGSVTWEIKAGPDTTIERVILGGYRAQQVNGLPAKTPISDAYRGAPTPDLPFYLHSIDTPAFRVVAETVPKKWGLPVSGFVGGYQADPGRPFVIDKVSDDPRLRADYPVPTPAAELPKLKFRALNYTVGERRFEVFASAGDFTLAGPDEASLHGLPGKVMRLTADPKGKKHYGISSHDIVEVDFDKHTTTKIAPGPDGPKISWPSDVAFDTKRNRLLLTTSTGGYLIAHDPAAGTWETLVENFPIAALAYHPKNDMLYAVKFHSDPVLFRINAKGAVIDKLDLDGPFFPEMFKTGPGPTGLQLVPADDHMVLLSSPHGLRGSEGPTPARTYMYLIDLKTGKTRLTWKGK
jgi:hypothetical protein